jgi:hypothetical protein
MGCKLGTGLVVTAGLIGAGGCGSTARPMLFQRNHTETPCPSAIGMPVGDGPIIGDMPMSTMPGTTMPGMTLPPDATMNPGQPFPPGTVTIPGPGAPLNTVAPPTASPPVGPVPRTAPAPQTNPARMPNG